MRTAIAGRLLPILFCGLPMAAVAGCDMGFGGSLFGPTEMRPVTVRFHGTVTSAVDGRPLEGVTVSPAYKGSQLRSKTNAAGRYTLDIQHECSVVWPCWPPIRELVAHLKGFDRGFAPRREDVPWVTIGDAKSVDIPLDFTLLPSRRFTLVVDGRVTRESNGKPLEGMTVVLDWDYWLPFEMPESSAVTDAEGRYEVTSERFCAISGSSCRTSFALGVEGHGLWSGRSFDDVEVKGDELRLTVDVDDL